MSKKIISITLLVALLLSCVACGKKDDVSSENQPNQSVSENQPTENNSAEEQSEDKKTDSNISVTQEEFEDLIDKANNSDNEEDKQAALSEIQKILEEVEKNAQNQ